MSRSWPPNNITERMVTGCFVIDHERFRAVSGRPAREAGIAIYQVEGRLIRRVWFAWNRSVVRRRARTIVQLQLRRRASRPQLGRDPLDGAADVD